MDESSTFSSCKTEKNRNPRGVQANFGFWGGLAAGGFCGFGDFEGV